MKKSVKIVSIVFVVLFAVIGIIVTLSVAIANSHNDRTSPTAEMATWMSHIKDDVLLKDVVIAGSHDSGCNEMMWMTKTQDRSVKQQLECGTRYFDLRVSKEDDGYKIFHDIIVKGDFVTIIQDIKNFIDTHPSEMLILDFQHFRNDVEFDLLNLIELYLGDKLIQNVSGYDDISFIDSLTMGDARGKCLVLWGKQSGEEFLKHYVFIRNSDDGGRVNSVLQSFYYPELNKTTSSPFIKNALPSYISMRKQNMTGLFVLQGQLTDPVKIFGPKLLEATHHKNMDAYVKALATSEDLEYINIIMRDFVSPHKNALTLSLNLQKGTVKEASVSAFEALIEQNV